MKYISTAVALVLLAVVADDIAYLVARWADFRSEDVSRHLQFHALVLAAVAWHSYLTARAWLNVARVHLKLLASLLLLVASIGAFLLLAPAFEKGAAFDGGFPISSIILYIAFLAADFVLVRWSWRASGAQPCNAPDLARKAARGPVI